MCCKNRRHIRRRPHKFAYMLPECRSVHWSVAYYRNYKSSDFSAATEVICTATLKSVILKHFRVHATPLDLCMKETVATYG